MLKKIYPVFCLLVIAAMLVACTPSAPIESPATQAPAAAEPTKAPAAPSGSQTVLHVWIMWGDNPAQLQSLFDKYGAANNVKVEVTAPVEEDKVVAALGGSEPPDVLITAGGDNVKTYNKEGLVTPLNDLIAANKIDLADFFSGPLGQCKLNDQILCLPWGTDVYALFWNKDLFEAAGLDPEKPPETLEQLGEYADKLTKKGDDGKLAQLGFVPDFPWGHTDLYARMFGGFWYNDTGTQLTANSQPMVDALTWAQQFYTKYGAQDVLTFTSAMGDYNSPDQAFYAGKIAMALDGEWQTGPNFIQKFKPELNYGVAPFPYPKDHPERKNSTVAQGTVALIPKGVKDPAASAKLLAWMMSPEIVAEEMYTNYNLPTSKKAAQDPRFLENPKFKVFMDLMADKNNFPTVTTPIQVEFITEEGSVEEQVLHNAGDPKKLLDELQAKYEPILADALK